MTILLFEDKLGITSGYVSTWESMVQNVGLKAGRIVHQSVWKVPALRKLKLLEVRGNRKTPGFNPDPEVQNALRRYVIDCITRFSPDLIICQDLTLLGLVEPDWNSATIDNMRGGLYLFNIGNSSIPFYIMTPISAVNTRKSTRDIAIMNQGVYSKDEWDALHTTDDDKPNSSDGDDEDPEEVYIEPYTIDLGKWIIEKDLAKLRRIYGLISTGRFAIRVPRITICRSEKDARVAYEFLRESILIANDIETNPKEGLMTVNGYTGIHRSGEKQTFVFPFYLDKDFRQGTQPDLEIFLDVSTRLNDSGIPFTFQNGGYDLFWHLLYGMPVRNYAYDSMTMFWSLWPELPKRLDFISSILLDDYHYWKGTGKSDNFDKYLIYNGLDCDRTLDDTIVLTQLLSDDPAAASNFYHAHLRVLYALNMSIRGVKSDEQVRERHKVTLAIEAEKALKELRYLVADADFNPNSPNQKFELLYKRLGIRMRTAKGRFTNNESNASTGAVPLRAMRGEHPIFRRIANGIMDSLKPAKQVSNVIGLSRAQWTTSNIRFHTGYNGVGTDTTRLSSSKSPINIAGNLQNIRKDYRDIIRSDDDAILLDIDFSAADDVFVSFESGDPHKIELARSGRDSHAVNCTIFFKNWTYEDVIKGKKAKDPRVVDPITGIRQITKRLSHGCNYLMAGLTLLMTAGREAIVAAAKELGYVDAGLWSQDRLVEFCEYLESLYRSHYTRFARTGNGSWYQDIKRELKDTGGFTSAFNYYQRFLGSPEDEKIVRAAAASAGQANTAGRVNAVVEELIFGRISPTFRDAPNPSFEEEPLRITRSDHGINLLLQNHDSLTFGILLTHPNWESGVDRIFRAMARPTIIKNKLTGALEEFTIGRETEVGTHWGPGLHTVPNSLEGVKLSLQ